MYTASHPTYVNKICRKVLSKHNWKKYLQPKEHGNNSECIICIAKRNIAEGMYFDVKNHRWVKPENIC
jgi:hypothetical protein